ncbi:hypothetical protein GCM10019016_075530 [Streptomyces prasinosporus]|uniref:Periplasmic binding protein domain-containing protein n=1 Tax=Streptomyces prasinosporus TaxID=68256 RepID=A0ABP6TZ56_9ACTN
MNPRTAPTASSARRSATALAAVLSALSLSACGVLDGGADDDPSSSRRNDITVGLLLPDRETPRFERFDRPLIEERVSALTDRRGEVVHANAGGSAEKQNEQFGKMIADGVDVILVDAVDAGAVAPAVEEAEEAGIPVIAYDRLAEGPVDAYVSHDNELVGEVQGRALVEALGADAATSKVVMMNGEPADPNTALFKKGALDELEGAVDIAASYDTEKWLPRVAKENMREAIRTVGAGNVAAVYSANDGMAGAVIEAMEEAGVTDLPPGDRAGRGPGGGAADRLGQAAHDGVQVVRAGGAGRRRHGGGQGPGPRHHVRRADPGPGGRPDAEGHPVDAGPGRRPHPAEHRGHGRPGRRLHRRGHLHGAVRRGLRGDRPDVVAVTGRTGRGGAGQDRAGRGRAGPGGAGPGRTGRAVGRARHSSEYPMAPTVHALTSASATRYMPPVSGMP